MSTILVVEFDRLTGSALGSRLEREGHEVLLCPGPGPQDYTCLGGRDETCPLERAADVIVLDLHLASDDMMLGTPGWQLLLHYVTAGKHVVAIVGDEDPVRPHSDDQVTVLRRPAAAETVALAVQAALLANTDFRSTSTVRA